MTVIALSEIEAYMADTLQATGMPRYAKFQELARLVDGLAEDLFYKDDSVIEQRRAFANLHHNAIGGFNIARNFTKNQFSDIPFRHLADNTPYTAEEVQAAIDRNDAVAVKNYADIINLFKLFLEEV
jgi:hypothetical protein